MPDIFSIEMLIPIIIIVFFSATVQGISGFGMGLIAVPLLAILVMHQIAVPLVTGTAIVVSTIIVLKYKAHIAWKKMLWLGIPAMCLSPFGVHLLLILETHQLQYLLGTILLLDTVLYFNGVLKTKKNGEKPANSKLKIPQNAVSVFIGAISGILGGALGMTGPLLANHLIKTGIQREEFKVTLNLIFLFSAIWRTILYFVQDVMKPETIKLGLYVIPVAILGIIVGGQLGKYIPNKQFVLYIHLFIGLIGVWQFVQATGIV